MKGMRAHPRALMLAIGILLMAGCVPTGDSQDPLASLTASLQTLLTFMSDMGRQWITAILL